MHSCFMQFVPTFNLMYCVAFVVLCPLYVYSFKVSEYVSTVVYNIDGSTYVYNRPGQCLRQGGCTDNCDIAKREVLTSVELANCWNQCAVRPFWRMLPLVSSTGQLASRSNKKPL